MNFEIELVADGEGQAMVVDVDVLQTIAQGLLKGNPKKTETIKETLEKSPSIEEMKKELKKYNELAETLLKKIEKEEKRIDKEVNHLIEKKVRTMHIKDDVLFGTNRKEYKTEARNFSNKETLKYVREGNSIICTITNHFGKFKGKATRHEEDKFDYEFGMMLAKVRAMKNMYSKLESDLAGTL